jgi:hypothetical protein
MKTMNDQITGNQIADPKWKSIYEIGGAAALIAGAFFLIGVVELIVTGLQPGLVNDSPFLENWLVVIFKVHAGFKGVQLDRLNGLNVPDIAILALVGMTVLGLYATLRRASKIWSIVALVQPILGLVLFITTKNAGRSSVMGAVLVISVVMLQGNMRNMIFKKSIAYMGILAGVLLLIGDLTAGVVHSNIIVFLFSIGYALLIAWLFLVARRLFQLGQMGSPQASSGNG